jgi:hypothetical protein
MTAAEKVSYAAGFTELPIEWAQIRNHVKSFIKENILDPCELECLQLQFAIIASWKYQSLCIYNVRKNVIQYLTFHAEWLASDFYVQKMLMLISGIHLKKYFKLNNKVVYLRGHDLILN